MSNQIVKLDGGNTSVVVRVAPYTEIVYWGKRLDTFEPDFSDSVGYPVPNGRLDTTAPLTLSPEQGRGMFSSPGMEGHRAGQDWAPIFSTIDYEADEDEGTLIVNCEDSIAQLGLNIILQVDPETGVLRTRQQLTNLGDEAYSVQRFALTLPLPDRAQELMGFHGRWLQEFQTHRIAPTHGSYIQESRRGRQHEYFPGMVAGSAHFSECNGEVWGIHLGWTGDHRIRYDVKSDGRRFMQTEALYQAGEISLDTDESLKTPWVYASYGEAGLNTMSHAFHQYVRQQLLKFPVDAERPVQLNIWEGVYFDHDPEYIMNMATASKELGIERFIIDDGWFRNRNDDYAGLGDWYVDEKKYPQGLGPVVDHIRSLGMQFGLWFEPEMVNPDSDLYRAHPDWVLGLPGYDQPTGRHQYVLDLCNNQVFDYLFKRVDAILTEFPIDYVKWDMNRDLVQASHKGRASSQEQTARFYALMNKLRKAHPNTEFESCASGGARIDYGVLRYVQRFWTSDCNDALERQRIQRGMSYFFPPEVMGAHIGAERCHSTLRRHYVGFRGLTALFGHMGVELDPLVASEEEREGFARYIELYKQLRGLLHTGRTIRLETLDEDRVLAHAVVSEDGDSAVVLIAQLKMPAWAMSEALRIPYLDPDKRYRIDVLDRPEAVQNDSHNTRVLPAWLNQEGFEATGEWLGNAGLRLPSMDSESALLLQLTAV